MSIFFKLVFAAVIVYLLYITYSYQTLISGREGEHRFGIADIIRPNKGKAALEEEELPPLIDNTVYALAYANKYAPLAQQEMKRYAIPASITLGQAILESQYGQSELALQANNHFGIKIDAEWVDTERHCMLSNEWMKDIGRMRPVLSCFKRYQSVSDCYDNHSQFLVKKNWYRPLFKLSKTDYHNWAKGLQSAGYATDPTYAQKLIDIIEKYDLAAYDSL